MNKILYVIDPGHYSKYNKGAAPGYYEGDKMQVLAAAQKKYLEQYGINTVILTKETAKENPSLLSRGKLAITKGKLYDIVIFESLHTNAPGANADPNKVYGVTAIRAKHLPDSEDFIEALMKTVVNTMKVDTEVTYFRGVSTRVDSTGKIDYYGVLRGALNCAKSVEEAAKGPVDYAFITEHGFHSNPIECAWLNDDKNLDLLAKNKAAKVAEWFGVASTEKDEDEYIETSIMGKSTCTAEQMSAYLLAMNPNAGVYATDIPKIFLEEGEVEGVRGDVAFAQSCHETGNFKFGGDVVPEQNNFAGIGTTGGGIKGAYFSSPRIGIRAQIQHLKAYASKKELELDCVDPRFKLVTRGVASNVEDLGGRWAYPGYEKSKYSSLKEAKVAKDSYGDKIMKILNKIEAIEIEDKKEEVVVSVLHYVGSDWKDGICINQAGVYSIKENAIKLAKEKNLKVFDKNGTQIYPEVDTPSKKTEYYRVAKNYTNGKYVGQVAACKVFLNAIKYCKEDLTVFSPTGESLYPKFKDIKITEKVGTIRIIKDGDSGEGVELHYTPEIIIKNLDKAHGPAHLGDTYDVVGVVSYKNNEMYALSNGSYITTAEKYVKFTKKTTKLTYTAGKYKTNEDMTLREGPGTSYEKIAWKDMTDMAKKSSPDKGTGAYYSKGVIFSALEVVNTDKTAWARTPSGWICIEASSKNKPIKYCTKIK